MSAAAPIEALAASMLMFTFAGAFATFTYLRPFLEAYIRVSLSQLSLLLLGIGLAGFAGTYGAGALLGRHLYSLLSGLPMALAAVTLGLLALASLIVGNGDRIGRAHPAGEGFNADMLPRKRSLSLFH